MSIPTMARASRASASLSARMAFSTLVQLVFWVRTAPTITSKGVWPGHQARWPKALSKAG